jgi:arylsulfatase A
MRDLAKLTAAALLVLVTTTAIVPRAQAASQPAAPPSFLVILADDLGAKELGCYGHPTHKTPNLDRLASEGMMFRTAYSTPLCSPTRVALMTSRYGFRTGWLSLIGRAYAPAEGTPEYDLGAREITFADVLKTRGYATALAGKWQLPGELPTLIHDCGFDEYCIWAYTHNLPKDAKYDGEMKGDRTSRYWHPAIVQNGKHVPTTEKDYGPDIHTDFILDFISRNRERPFLAYCPTLQTHSPFDPTPDPTNPGRKTPPGFQSNLEYLDHLVGRMVTGLEKLGKRESTIIIFVGDNGTQGSGKGEVTELGSRVPLIVSCPGIVKAGVVSDELVEVTDILPTLAEFAGASPPADRVIDGKSFAGVLQGETTGTREWIFSYLTDRRMLRSKRWLLEGDGKFYDCGDSRDGTGYVDVTNSKDPVVVEARQRFEEILKDLPAPTKRLAGGQKDRTVTAGEQKPAAEPRDEDARKANRKARRQAVRSDSGTTASKDARD